jgi:SMC interacting uncharacterized protein involved in chromosome segregation
MNDHKECTEVRAKLEQDMDTLKRSNKYLTDKFSEVNAKLQMAVEAGAHAARTADHEIKILNGAMNQLRNLVGKMWHHVPFEVKEEVNKEYGNVLDTTKLL